jgi:signal transduction histidine kinase/CheY-like chemotaxis protein
MRGLRVAVVPGVLVGVIGATALFQNLTGADLRIDTLLMFDRVWGQGATTARGRMGLPASTSFTLLGIAFSLSPAPEYVRRVAPILALLVIGITWLSLIGYLFNAAPLFTMPLLTAIALQTSLMLFCVAIGIIVASSAHEPMRTYVEESSAGRLARQSVPFIVVLPIALALLALQGLRAQLFDESMGTALLVLMLTSLLLFLLWRGVSETRAGEAALREQDRRKDEFLATLAHELRNPLAPVSNALTLLKRSGDPKVFATTREIMERQIGHMVRLIDDLLDISRISSGKLELRPQAVDAVSVVRDAVDACRPICERNQHQLSVEVPSAPVRLRADPVRLAQIFSNLISNATKFTPPGGNIRVTLETRRGRMVFAVTDDGIGIPPDKLGHIFELFAQVDSTLERRHDGLGIGLTLAKRMAELHGGTINAYSDGPGRGSTFSVSLPGASEGTDLEAETLLEKPREHLRVLVVDDNHDTAESLAMLLRMNGTEIHTAHDGEQAVDAALELKPDAILLDIGLPKMNGYQACREIRSRLNGHKVLILALTGYGQEEDKSRSLEAGFDGHLVKPVDHAELDRLLATVRPG